MRLLFLFALSASCRSEPTQILVHVRTTSPPQTMSAVRLEVERGGEKKSMHVLDRDPSDLGELGSFGIIPEDGDLDAELVLVLTALDGDREAGSYVRRIDGFANREKRQVFVCLAERCLGSQAACGDGLACSLDGCEPEALPTFGAPYASWERCLVSEPPEKPPPPPPPDDLDPPLESVPGVSIFSAGGSGDQRIVDVALDRDRSVLMGGNAAGALSIGGRDLAVQGDDAFLARATPDRTIVWMVQATGAGAQTITAVELDAAGGVFVAGTFDEELRFVRDGAELDARAGSEGTDIFVARFSRDGALEALAILASPGDDRARGLAVVPETGAIAVSGALGGVLPEESDCAWPPPRTRPAEAAFVAGLDAVELSCKFGVTFGGDGPSEATAIMRAPRGIVAGGTFEARLSVDSGQGRPLELVSLDADADAFLATIDFAGGVERLVQVGGAGRDAVLALGPSRHGELVAAGAFGPGDRTVGSRTATTAGGQVLALAVTADLVLARAYATTFPPVALVSSRVELVRGSLVIGGGFQGSLALPDRPVLEADGDAADAWLLRMSRLGRPLDVFRLGAGGEDIVHALAVDEREPRVIAAGEFAGSIELGDDTLLSTGGQDAFVYGIEVEP
jgi:hypothetical protein